VPNDAKLGMVVGLGLVLAVAVFLVRKDVPPGLATAETARTTVSSPAAAHARPMQQVSGTPAPRPARRSDAEEREDEAPGVTVSAPKNPPAPDEEP
jgi:hypothetical protein